tara:strand:+ start:814 stop:978 length:165 start_codon:yes stop_codon:yes gene_type:complete
MARQKTLDYILGMITGPSLIIALWACTGNSLSADVQEVKIVNEIWHPVNLNIIN